MARVKLSRKIAIGLFTFLAFFSIFPSFVLTGIAEASPSICPAPSWNPPHRGWYKGYFSDRSYPYCGDELFAVLNDGLPNHVDTKSEFIDFVWNMNLSTRGSGDAEANRNFTGTSYLIQTMRGVGDYGFPDDADLNDWRARVENPGISVTRGGYSAAVNSARMNIGGPRDAMSYYGDGVNYDSLIFWYEGRIVYVVKYACANPLGGFGGLPDPINFSLDPTVTGSPTTAESGSTATIRPVVSNGGSTSSTSVHWELNRFTLAPADGIPGGGTTSAGPGGHYGHTTTRIDQGNTAFPTGNTRVADGDRVLPNAVVGSKICYALSVQPVTQSDGRWRHSPPFCITISKKPKVQVQGGDLIVGRDSASNEGRTSTVDTSVSNLAASTYGSWSEYAIVSSGRVRGMASGSAYVGGSPTSALCSLSLLTFGNGGNPTCVESGIGNYTHTSASPNVGARFPTSSTTPRITSASVTLSSMQGLYTTARTTLDITGGADIGATTPGQWIVINAPDTNVRITGNIRYTNNDLTRVEDIPQVVIIAKNIMISDAVGNIDAWLAAVGSEDDPAGVSGNLNTCGAGGVSPTTLPHAGQCGTVLTVNGPISANHIYLRRTGGANPGARSGEPAEVFNLRADSYIWASGYNAGTGRLPTVKMTELPPRF